MEIRKILFILLITFFSVNSEARKVYEGKDCFNYAKIIYDIEHNRNNGIKKEALLNHISLSNLQVEVKKVFLSNIDFLYTFKDGYLFTKQAVKQCYYKGKIVIDEI